MQSSATKVALITGANKGIGFEIARQLGQRGCAVLLGARNPERGQKAAAKLQSGNLDVQFVELDLGRRQTIEAASAFIGTKFGKLDILVNNAGIADPGDGLPGTADMEAVQRIMQTNFLGALSVAQCMLPLLRKSLAGRIVNVSSGLGSLTFNSDFAGQFAGVKLIGYCASKAALNMLTVHLAYELRDTAIKVNSADPGYTATDLNGHSGYQTVEEGAAEAVRLSLLPADSPTGGFFASAGPEPW
jgi:NAD(P)-dependent dehydrogenase (short-subunit alcohol dehydrogenase family)